MNKISRIIKQNLFVALVILPIIIFTIYQMLIATQRYESKTQLIVQQPDSMATMDAGMALLSGLGVPTGNQDTQLVKSYIYSYDMLKHLEESLSIKKHFSDKKYDWISRLKENATNEEFQKYFQGKIRVEIDEKSSVISVYSQAFDPKTSFEINKEIARKSEWFINNISHQLAESQLDFIKKEHQIAEIRLQETKKRLIQFQTEYQLLDPEKEGSAISQIAYELEGKIAVTKAELKAVELTMSNGAPQVIVLKNQVMALESQLDKEKSRLTDSNKSSSINEVLLKFADLKIDLEMALSSYSSSNVSLEKSRIEAYRKLKFLIVVEESKLPEDSKYPEVIYNISLFTILLLIFFGILRIIIATIKELN
ncbi:lipopolysaccharide biosynthesis protein [Enterovibrio norvegicus]|uniref:lipopolysaccharide biosynthesis protein n=1 Tax=Enterovibrio norvegicus TaxID=188144 RepID=UPI000C830349|nr:lipopolysaccharide biosynthesis protein [Enterovibrio norvegicus]PMI35244.1 lipopolysaccharide biosynthesis protein [Enterovibrio norvegicus]PMN47122.1 lipopolysaccharide biosynthesis protein [Enterovibrio norvegicus]